MKFDRLDLEIIKHLQANARVSLREIGKRLGVPHTTIFTRVNKLRKKGIIKKFSAILHPHDLGLKTSFLFVDPLPSESRDVAKKFSEHEEIRRVFRTVDGKIIAELIVPDTDADLEEVLTKIEGFPMKVYPIHEVVKFEHGLHDDALKVLLQD